jgi:DNA polymerase-3 subunit epsilon
MGKSQLNKSNGQLMLMGLGLLDGPLVYVDIETNGLNHLRGRVIEVAAIRVEQGKIVKKFSSLVDPETELPQFITSLTGITSSDLRGAPTFSQIADELYEVIEGAVFVAHNVRFDYSFLKQEYKRLNQSFLPKQLCTVKLSRTLFPDQRGHKLQDLISRYQLSFTARHRAYDDAHVLWQFIQYVQKNVAVEIIEAAVARQLRQPAIPKTIPNELVKDLPGGPGVYIFEDEAGRPLYVGKSVNIRKRVLQHFGQDHSDTKEYKIAQTIHNIRTQETEGELSALLLESELVKELQPLYNRQLRRTSKLIVARSKLDDNGYMIVWIEEADMSDIDAKSNILATYPRRGRARDSFNEMVRVFGLCPKLMSIEKSSSSCFLYQLHKCHGACIGKEPANLYNQRVLEVFERKRIQAWPYRGPVLVQERFSAQMLPTSAIIVDQWCVIGQLKQEEDCEPVVSTRSKVFDLDTYKILQSFLITKAAKLYVKPLSSIQLSQLGI